MMEELDEQAEYLNSLKKWSLFNWVCYIKSKLKDYNIIYEPINEKIDFAIVKIVLSRLEQKGYNELKMMGLINSIIPSRIASNKVNSFRFLYLLSPRGTFKDQKYYKEKKIKEHKRNISKTNLIKKNKKILLEMLTEE
jgi:hypothetical protein